ncbi:MAG: exodeoxyribonuclease VII small subunit [Bacteroidales bacterium]
MKGENLNYTEAYKQLQQIILKMESSQMQVDELSDNIKKATNLIHICKEKLTIIESDVNSLIQDIEKQNIQ